MSSNSCPLRRCFESETEVSYALDDHHHSVRAVAAWHGFELYARWMAAYPARARGHRADLQPAQWTQGSGLEVSAISFQQEQSPACAGLFLCSHEDGATRPAGMPG